MPFLCQKTCPIYRYFAWLTDRSSFPPFDFPRVKIAKFPRDAQSFLRGLRRYFALRAPFKCAFWGGCERKNGVEFPSFGCFRALEKRRKPSSAALPKNRKIPPLTANLSRFSGRISPLSGGWKNYRILDWIFWTFSLKKVKIDLTKG